MRVSSLSFVNMHTESVFTTMEMALMNCEGVASRSLYRYAYPSVCLVLGYNLRSSFLPEPLLTNSDRRRRRKRTGHWRPSVVQSGCGCCFASGTNTSPPWTVCSSSSSSQSVVVRGNLVDMEDTEGGFVVDKIRGAVAVVGIGTGPGVGAAVVGVSPGETAELSILEMPAKSDNVRFWLSENLSREAWEQKGGERKSKQGA